MKRRAGQLSEAAANHIIAAYQGELTFTNKAHLLFLTTERIEGFHNLFYAQNWKIRRATGRWRFITTVIRSQSGTASTGVLWCLILRTNALRCPHARHPYRM